MIFETSRGRSALLCHSWQFKLCFVWGGELVSTLTSSILQMGLIWHLALTTGSSSLLSLASLAGFLPIALFGILAGAVVDRLPLKRVLIGADLFIAAVGAALAIASLAGSLPAWLILIALFLRAVGTSFYTPASQSLTPHLAPPEHLVRLSGVTQAIQSGGYILGAALAAVIYPVAGITAMIVLDVLGALFASLAVLAAQIDAGGLDEADRSLSFSNKVRELFSEISDGYKLIREYRGLFALLWCGFVFAFAFSPLAALFPIMTLGHFGGSTGDAALVEILFSAGMLAGSGILAVTGGFRNRSFTMVAAIAGFGIAAIVSGSLGPSLFAAFLPVSFLMGACSPLYAGTQTALMQEQIPPEYLGRVFGLYGTIMAWAMPMGLAAPSVFADFCGSAWSSVMVRRLWSDHGTACDGYAACSERPKRGEKRYRADSIAQVFEKKRQQPSVQASAFKPLRRRGIAPTSRIALLIRRQLSFSDLPACARSKRSRRQLGKGEKST